MDEVGIGIPTHLSSRPLITPPNPTKGGRQLTSYTNQLNQPTMWKAVKAWYFKTFLPFEDPSSPKYTAPPYDPGEDEDWDFLEEEKKEGVGPNYGRKAFSKAKTYKKWGGKYYKEG